MNKPDNKTVFGWKDVFDFDNGDFLYKFKITLKKGEYVPEVVVKMPNENTYKISLVFLTSNAMIYDFVPTVSLNNPAFCITSLNRNTSGKKCIIYSTECAAANETEISTVTLSVYDSIRILDCINKVFVR